MALDTLDAQPTQTLIELFFESQEPDERDTLFDAVAGRDAADTAAFMAAVMEHDEDPYLQVAAAKALWPHKPLEAQQHLCSLIAEGGDELLVEEALAALCAQPWAGLSEFVRGLVDDKVRDVAERRVAFVALLQLDENEAQSICRERLRAARTDVQGLIDEPLDLLALMLASVVRAARGDDRATMADIRASVARLQEDGAGDRELVLDMFDEALAVMDASAEELKMPS